MANPPARGTNGYHQVALWQTPVEQPALPDYDLIILNSSGGKDSQAMMDVVVCEAGRQGVPLSRIVVFHADMGRVEWPGTPELVREHADHYGLRCITMARPQGDLLDHIEARGMFPDAARRYCTSDHKRGQGRKVLTALVAELGLARPASVLNCMGFRREESPARLRKVPLRRDEGASNGRRRVDEWLPILDWAVEQVWERIAQAGTRPHPAYRGGMPRLSCSFCVLASRSALVRAAQMRPQLADEYAALEARIGHRFRTDLSMAQIVAEARTTTIGTIEGWTA